MRADVAGGHPASRGRARRSSARPRRLGVGCGHPARPSRDATRARCYIAQCARPHRAARRPSGGGEDARRPDRAEPLAVLTASTLTDMFKVCQRFVQTSRRTAKGSGVPRQDRRAGAPRRRPDRDAARLGAPLRRGRPDPRRLRLPPLQRGRRAPPGADARPDRRGAGAGRGGSPGRRAEGAERRWRGRSPPPAICATSWPLACAAFDEHRANPVLDRAVPILSIDALLDDVLLPVLRGLQRARSGRSTSPATSSAGGCMALARGWGAGAGRLALLACPEGELHDLGLIAFGLSLRSRGWRVSFLGANTPIAALTESADEIEPEVVVLSASHPAGLRDDRGRSDRARRSAPAPSRRPRSGRGADRAGRPGSPGRRSGRRRRRARARRRSVV